MIHKKKWLTRRWRHRYITRESNCDRDVMKEKTYLQMLSGSSSRMDVERCGVVISSRWLAAGRADVGRSFARRDDHVQFREECGVTKIAIVARLDRRWWMLLLQLLLSLERLSGAQFSEQTGFLRMSLCPSHRIFTLPQLLLLPLQPRQSGRIVRRGHPINIKIKNFNSSFIWRNTFSLFGKRRWSENVLILSIANFGADGGIGAFSYKRAGWIMRITDFFFLLLLFFFIISWQTN